MAIYINIFDTHHKIHNTASRKIVKFYIPCINLREHVFFSSLTKDFMTEKSCLNKWKQHSLLFKFILNSSQVEHERW